MVSLGLAKGIKEVLERCAASMDIEDAKQLRKASTHWLRHTHGSHALNGRPGETGVPIQVVQNNLGHASIGDQQFGAPFLRISFHASSSVCSASAPKAAACTQAP